VSGNREAAEQKVLEALHASFRPEFLNRIDDQIIFSPLSRADLGPILEIQLKRVQALLLEKELAIDLTEEAKTALCEAGFDPDFGARPLKRAIQQFLLNPMAKQIVGAAYQPGDTIQVRVDGNAIVFHREPGPTQDTD
jgi:ATP-dependent Clp protease ATP-binding subunit ClpA